MTIDEAIQDSKLAVSALKIYELDKLVPGVELGIEAMKRYKELRSQRVILDWERLPGET